MLCHCWSINRRWKQSNCRPWNRQWILSNRRRMESTVSMNSRPTHQIDSKTRVIADAWNCQKTLWHYWSINRQRKQSPCWSWNRQWILSDTWRMESTSSMNSRPTLQIDSKIRVMTDTWNCQIHYGLSWFGYGSQQFGWGSLPLYLGYIHAVVWGWSAGDWPLGCCSMQFGTLLYTALYTMLPEADWNSGLLESDLGEAQYFPAFCMRCWLKHGP